MFFSNLNSGSDTNVHCTRFVALAFAGNKENKKWLLALSIAPIDKMKFTELYQQTTDQTLIPYSGSALSSKCNVAEESSTQFFYDMSSPGSPKSGKKRRHDGSHKRSREKPTFDPGIYIFKLFYLSRPFQNKSKNFKLQILLPFCNAVER